MLFSKLKTPGFFLFYLFFLFFLPRQLPRLPQCKLRLWILLNHNNVSVAVSLCGTYNASLVSWLSSGDAGDWAVESPSWSCMLNQREHDQPLDEWPLHVTYTSIYKQCRSISQCLQNSQQTWQYHERSLHITSYTFFLFRYIAS